MSWQQYLTEVLGVQSVVWPENLGPTPGTPVPEPEVAPVDNPDRTRILFLSEPGEQSLAQMDLFQKMVGAMKLEPGEDAVWEMSGVDLATHESQIHDDWVVVSFSKKHSSWLAAQRSKLILITTHHPQDCEKNPALKRQVWDDLKKALEKAGLSARLQS